MAGRPGAEARIAQFVDLGGQPRHRGILEDIGHTEFDTAVGPNRGNQFGGQ